MKKQLLLFTAMMTSFISVQAETLSETIDGFFKPLVDNYLVPVITLKIPLIEKLAGVILSIGNPSIAAPPDI